ncbi:hypothetical protein [Streptomyces sp. NPDC002788]
MADPTRASVNTGTGSRRHGAAVHDFRLWSRIYPPAGRAGYPPIAFVFTGKTAAQRESPMLRLEEGGRLGYL